MPFTFSHPAIILPLNYLPKKWISLTGLIIGSLTPDFEYFLRMKIESNYSHTISGIFWFDLPLGILLTFIFHNLVKNELYKNSPKILSERLLNIKELNWNKHFVENWKIIIISILIGTASHIFWDGFTHNGGFFVKNIPELSKTIEINGTPIKILKILQHLSTLIGAIIIAVAIWKLPKIADFENKINLKYWIIVALITLSFFTLKIISGENSRLIGNVIVSLISSGMIGIIITPIILNKKNGS
ncbi:DUF4184 family protein [Flavobacterium sp. H122]|uniref:DUF4184 family protein n=1 Tax=Flavobacterium sp. H122 TaxID=2529860 RepID=UPI0010AAD25E|nr:DUF4184 family protein [Flavobacterium sp. H122]